MLALPPLLLAPLARLLGGESQQRRTAAVLRRLSRTHLPVLAAERFAARSPQVEPGRGGEGPSPFLVHLPKGPRIEGPLAGESVIVKDSYDVAGARTGLGLLDEGAIAERDAVIVARVRAAGGVLAGKAKMTELGLATLPVEGT